jgi:hypothetical protein
VGEKGEEADPSNKVDLMYVPRKKPKHFWNFILKF